MERKDRDPTFPQVIVRGSGKRLKQCGLSSGSRGPQRSTDKLKNGLVPKTEFDPPNSFEKGKNKEGKEQK